MGAEIIGGHKIPKSQVGKGILALTLYALPLAVFYSLLEEVIHAPRVPAEKQEDPRSVASA